MRNPLNSMSVGGYGFKQKTSYSPYHLGTDYTANYWTLYAPTDGYIESAPYGKQGGQWLHFRDENGYLWRFGHLSKVSASGYVREGQVIGITGNSGSLSTNPHLHIDITEKGLNLDINNINNFVDPEIYIKEGVKMSEAQDALNRDYNNRLVLIDAKAVALQKAVAEINKQLKAINEKLSLPISNISVEDQESLSWLTKVLNAIFKK